MVDLTYIGNFTGGLKTDRLPFNINNDTFPTMVNFYSWRGRAKRKRGTALLGQAEVQVFSTNATATITGASAANPCVITAANTFLPGQLVTISGVTGMTQLNGNTYVIVSANVGSFTINVDSSAFTPYTSGGTATLYVQTDLTASITGATQANPCVITAANSFAPGMTVFISGVAGMTQLNGNSYSITAATATNFTVNVNSTGFGAYTSGGVGTVYNQLNTNSWMYSGKALAADSINLFTAFSKTNHLGITPGSLSLIVGANTYTEPAIPDGTLVGIPAGTGTINYATGAVTITGGGTSVLTGQFSYYPGLPIMGLENFSTTLATTEYPYLLTFDQQKAYFFNSSTRSFYNISYYKQTGTPFSWSGLDYQQFWSTNYSSSFWATNNVPGFHILSGTYVSGSTTTNVIFNFKNNGSNFANLIVGDVLWFNEWSGSTNLNGITGTVTDNHDAANGNYVVTFSSTQTVASTGIVQMLTNSLSGQDGIRWLDGDPTDNVIASGDGFPSASGYGWVNFAPPLTATTVSINDTPSDLYYLVGALIVIPYKDRILFFSPFIQSSTRAISGLPPFQLQSVVIWSQNGTPYYTSPVPKEETFTPSSYYIDTTGFGGYLAAGISQPIVTVNNNEDVLLVSFTQRQTRFVYTGNDISPFLFFTINSELGTSSTYSGVTLDRGGITIGQYGISMTDQQSSQRIDLDIPDYVFQINASNNGAFRVNGVRDYFKEWIYFCYPVSDSQVKFPTQTFLWNYRDNTWAILYENFTAHGTYRSQNGYTWLTQPFGIWEDWNEPWNSGIATAQFPSVVGGTPQGYVLLKGTGTGEGVSGAVMSIANSGGLLQITSPNHCVSEVNSLTGDGDFVYLSGFLGTTSLNGLVGKVISRQNDNTFTLDVAYPSTGIYGGLGQFSRLSQPLIQTKQFNFYWERGRQAILGVQKYLLDRTPDGQVTVNIYLSQDPSDAWNSPINNPEPSSLVYSQILYTCPESTNIGLSAANTNLQMPTAATQFQIWHRMNTSLIGDTVQIGITLSDAQMKDYNLATSEIALHAMVLSSQPGPQLA